VAGWTCFGHFRPLPGPTAAEIGKVASWPCNVDCIRVGVILATAGWLDHTTVTSTSSLAIISA
jgi:hypothetical protein